MATPPARGDCRPFRRSSRSITCSSSGASAGPTRGARGRRDDRAVRHGPRAGPAVRRPSPACANTIAIRSTARRRAANPRTCADARSSHWASSITQRRPRSRAASDSSPRTASATRNGFGAGPEPEPERDVERVALRARQSLTEGQDRRAELLDRGERELHLALDPGGADDPQRRGLLDQRRRGAPSCRRRARHGRRARRRTRRGRTPPAGQGPLARVPGPATAPGVTSLPVDEGLLVAPQHALGSRTTEFRDAIARRVDTTMPSTSRTRRTTHHDRVNSPRPSARPLRGTTSPKSSPAATRNAPATTSRPTSPGTAARSGPSRASTTSSPSSAASSAPCRTSRRPCRTRSRATIWSPCASS